MEAHGWLSDISVGGGWLIALLMALALGFLGARLWLWTAFAAAALFSLGVPLVLTAVVVLVLIVMNVPQARSALVTNHILAFMERAKLMPTISETEKVALDAGTTWVDAELFSGKPDFDKLLKEAYPKLNAEEQAFLDNQCSRLVELATDWEVFQHGDLPKQVWDYLKKERFFGMIISKEFGGLGFSALGHSAVVAKLTTHCGTLATTCMVPNSLGPGELLQHYGTKQQKDYYLPRLARGEEIPCFGLTEPNAGSDAGSIQSKGVLFKENGKLMLRLDWEKRYITLAAVSTLIGLAVKIEDPDNLLGKGHDLGITCVLVPAATSGVVLGRRHNPMGVPFYNCPTSGHGVVVSVDQVIGGQDGIGRGWQMLMECLAAGRAISLPSQSAGSAKLLTRLTSAYAVVRRQFGVPIGDFEGIEEPLARITGLTYLMEAARIYTCGAVDAGMKPAVVSAICKYNQTELARKVVNDAMDILGGAAISRGPKNRVAHAYISMPISITVEGANILTRTMIIFGQGALRCHPYAYKELTAVMAKDRAAFDRAFWGHIGHVVQNLCRSVVLSVTRGAFAFVPGGPGARYWRKLAWSSASFAIMADFAMAALGGSLKMREKLTGRYADVLSWMYLAVATLRRYEAEGSKPEHRAVFDWAMQYCLARIQEGFDGIFTNFDVPVPLLGGIMRGPIAFWSRVNPLSRGPSDKLGHQVSKAIQTNASLRDDMTGGIVLSTERGDHTEVLEEAFRLAHDAQKILGRISAAVKEKRLPKKRANLLVKEALAAQVITEAEAQLLERANALREEAIQVDSFALDEFRSNLLDVRDEAHRGSGSAPKGTGTRG